VHVFIVMNFVVVAQLLCFVLDGHTDFFPNSPGLFFYNFNVELFRLKPSILIIYSKLRFGILQIISFYWVKIKEYVQCFSIIKESHGN